MRSNACNNTAPMNWPPRSRSCRAQAFLRQYQDFMQLILVGAAVVNVVVTGEWATTIVLLLLTMFNAALALRGEAKAAASLAALQSTMKDTTRVRRDGVAADVDASQVVPGDIVLLQAGDRVPPMGVCPRPQPSRSKSPP